MARILAIDSDPVRIAILRRLVSERLDAELFVAASADDAIRTLGVSCPDLILTSSLLPLNEAQQLASHLRKVPSLDHLPVLTIPLLVDERDQAHRQGLMSYLLRRRRPIWPAYDTDAVTARIEEALEQSRIDAARYGEVWRPARLLLTDSASPGTAASDPDTNSLIRALEVELELFCSGSLLLERAPRWKRCELPWLESIKLSWGADLNLLNISCSGLLVESGIRMTLGNSTDFQLAGGEQDFVIPGRVVRTDVSSVDRLGVKYVAAAVFEQPFDLLGPNGSLPPDLSLRRIARAY